MISTLSSSHPPNQIGFPSSMYGSLIPCGGGDTIPLLQTKLLVGRRSRCDICLRFKNVSSHHCELEMIDGYWHIRDLGSSNGIKVNGVRVDTKCLAPGDEVMIARHAFNIEYELAEDATHEGEQEDPFARPLMEKAGLEVARGHRMPQKSSQKKATSHGTSAEDEFLMEWLSDD